MTKNSTNVLKTQQIKRITKTTEYGAWAAMRRTLATIQTWDETATSTDQTITTSDGEQDLCTIWKIGADEYVAIPSTYIGEDSSFVSTSGNEYKMTEDNELVAEEV